ncbi:hypothetical protein DL96DRAFT_267622 [Flagelloscypha sp. PMI_526]|nr:hypothetical protein DL96DRAFT_267622 [Flagelloscypha sp. PMI_526]
MSATILAAARQEPSVTLTTGGIVGSDKQVITTELVTSALTTNGATQTIILAITRAIPTPSNSASNDPISLRPSAIAGVVIGALIVLFLIPALLFICLRWRRRRTIKDAQHQDASRGMIPTVAPLPAPIPRNAALEKENLVLQDKIRDMSESMKQMQREMQDGRGGYVNNVRMSVGSQVSDGPPDYQTVLGTST